ncbi:MAG: hypothetical protein WBC65_12740 [Ignavibacteria bacterium]
MRIFANNPRRFADDLRRFADDLRRFVDDPRRFADDPRRFADAREGLLTTCEGLLTICDGLLKICDGLLKICCFSVVLINDLTGRLVSCLLDKHLLSSSYETDFDAGFLSRGFYVYTKVIDGNTAESRKLAFLKQSYFLELN